VLYRIFAIAVCLICPSAASFGQGTALSATFTTTPSTCGNDNGSATILASGGTPPYTYSFSGLPFQSSAYYIAALLYPFQALVKDATGTTFPLTITIPYTKPAVSVSPISGAGASGCGTSDGQVTLQAINGLPPYSYSIDMVNWQTSPTFNGLAPGDYLFFARDANGCVGQKMWFENSSNCYIGADYETPGYFYSICGASASIYVVPRNVPSPLQYSIDGGTTYQSDPNFIVNTGQYTIKILDGTGTPYLFHLPVFPSCPLSLNTSIQSATCGNNDGLIIVNAAGGAPPYTYSVDGIHFQGSNTFSGVPGGNYTILVMDANGNIQQFQKQIVNGGCPPVTATAVETDASCTANVGTITITAGGGTPPYQYSIDGVAWQGANTFLEPPGSYTVTVMDTKGSPTSVDATVALVSNLTITTAGNPTICPGQTITLATQSNGQQFSWMPATTLDDPTTLQPRANPDTTTTYTLTAVLGSCQATAVVTVHVTPPPNAFIGNDTSIAAGQPLPLNVADVNNSGFTMFSWSPPNGLNDPNIRNPIVDIVQSTTYTLVAATPFGCAATASIAIKVYGATDIFVPNAFTPNDDGHNDILRAVPIGIRLFSSFAVFDHWGQRVFYTRNATEGWDGTYKGHRQNAGTYIWMAAGTDYNGHTLVRTGTVILIR
jgi:gliding motility-associated-like protein